jgi:hypothetical protein
MPIKISKVEGGYMASVTPSQYKDTTWSNDAPMKPKPLVEKLRELGYHLQDIQDAFYEVDRDWRSGYDDS